MYSEQKLLDTIKTLSTFIVNNPNSMYNEVYTIQVQALRTVAGLEPTMLYHNVKQTVQV